MYQDKDRKYAIIAIGYYIVLFSGYFLMGIMYKKGFGHYSLIQWLLGGVVILITLLKDKSINNLGFSKERIKPNLVIASIIVIIAVCFALVYSDIPALRIFRGAAYYLIYISLLEEMIFRGFIQNYLFGMHVNRKITYAIGALFFSLMHLPFQMYVNDMVSVSYVIVAAPQLVFTFLFHLLMCFITYKTKDILIPTAVHFAIDFVQAVV